VPFQDKPPAIVKPQPTVKQSVSGSNNRVNATTGNNSPITTIITTAARNPRFKEKVETVTFNFGFRAIATVESLKTKRMTPLGIGTASGEAKPFAVYMEGDTLYVDALVFGLSTGSPRIQITHNEFSQAPVGWDRNFDDDALEFVDSSGVPVFQLVYRGHSDVFIRGMFSSGGMIFLANELGFVQNPSGAQVREFIPPKPIFRYPSVDHQSKRVPT
jgi:hypothetical protein